MKKCKCCGKSITVNRYQGYCQSCYRYFVIEHKEQYSPYSPSEGPKFISTGDCICPICGRAYRKLGSHIFNSHGMSKDIYKEFGWDVRKKVRPSNASYRKRMKEVQDPKTIEVNLKVGGQDTQFGKPKGNTMALNTRVVEARCSNCEACQHEDKYYFCHCYNKECKFVIRCRLSGGDK